MKLGLAVALIGVLVSSSVAFAQGSVAVLTSSEGKVLINKGHGFVPADGLVDLSVGDTVMVGKNSTAAVSFNSGCTVNVAPASVLKIGKKASCAADVAFVGKNVFVAPTADVVPPVAGIDPGLALAGLATVAGVGTLVYLSISK